jgi:hypothetical protein
MIRIANVVVALSLIAGAARLDAQVVSGVVRDSNTSAPVANAEISLERSGKTTYGKSSAAGVFSIRVSAPGTYSLAAHRIGYSPVIGRRIDVGQEGTSNVVVRMRPVPQLLDTVTTTGPAERQKLTPGSEMVRRHLLLGKGLIVSGLAIQQSGMLLSEYLGKLPGVRISRAPIMNSPTLPGRDGFLVISEKGAAPCIYGRINHTSVLQLLTARNKESIDDLLDPREVMAVEIYRTPAEIPAEWRMDMEVYEIFRRLNKGEKYLIGQSGMMLPERTRSSIYDQFDLIRAFTLYPDFEHRPFRRDHTPVSAA